MASLAGMSGLAGIATCDDGRERHISDLLDYVIYYDLDVRNLETMVAEVLPGGVTEAWRTPHRPPTYRFEERRLSLRHVGSWGGLSDAKAIADIHARIADDGYGSVSSGGSFAKKLVRKHCRIKPLQEEHWRISLNAVHQGHIGVFQRNAKYAVLNDRIAAYLNAMDTPMPPTLCQPIACAEGEVTQEWLTDGWEGIVSGWWEVPDIYIPPLPSKVYGRTIYPVGEVYSTVTSELARIAIEAGCVLRRSTDAITFQARKGGRHLAEVVSVLRALPKQIAKPTYTVLWGTFAGRGYWHYDYSEYATATKEERDEHWNHYPDSTLPWRERTIMSGEDADPTFRPDLAASIASRNATIIADEIGTQGHRVLLAHVDAIVTDVAISSPGWAVKARGPFAGYSSGNYSVGSHVATAGMPPGEIPEAWFATVKEESRVWHDWYSDPPRVSAKDYLMEYK